MEYTTTAQRKERFLEAFKENGMILRACRETGISRTTCYRWMAQDALFKSKVADAYREVYNDPSKKEILESLPMHKQNHLCPIRVVSTEVKESHYYKPRRKKTTQEILGQATNRITEIYNLIALSITKEDIKSMSPKDRLWAVEKLSYIHKNMDKPQQRNFALNQININTASVQELENYLLRVNEE